MLLLSRQTPTLSQDTILVCKTRLSSWVSKHSGDMLFNSSADSFFQPLCPNQAGEQGPGESGEAVSSPQCVQVEQTTE